MPFAYNKRLVSNARSLRNNMTDEEKRLWYDFLKKLPLTVNRQKNIGKYIVDFYIHSAKTVIELDGIQHEMTEYKVADQKRDSYLRNLDITVLRYANREINENFNFVCNDILRHLGLRVTDLKK